MSKEAMKLALEALDGLYLPNELARLTKAITIIKDALARPEHEKYCLICQGVGQVDTGIMESPVTICNACNGTGLKAQPEHPKQNTVEAVKAVLKGIDQTEIESPDGWWETSAGAEFGAKKLKYVIGLLAQPEQEPVAAIQLINRLERQWHRIGELLERCQGKGWPTAESDEFTALRDEKTPANRKALLALYTTPPQRTWVGLTDEEVFDVWLNEMPAPDKVFYQKLCRSVEAKLKEKNT